MYKLLFQKEKSFFVITIEDRKILYWDSLQGKLWNGALQYLPRDENMINKLVRKIKSSRNRIPAYMIELFDVPKDELEEYEKANTNEELREIVLRDCKKNNCKLIKEEKI